MKQAIIYFGWFIAGGALGALESTVLFGFWFHLGWRKPVAAWLLARGFGQVAGYWGLAWIHIPEWLIVGFTSIVAALYVRRRLLLKVALFSVAFVLVPLLISVAYGYDPLAYRMRVLLEIFMWNASDVLLAVSVAVSIRAIRPRFKNEQRGFGVSPAE